MIKMAGMLAEHLNQEQQKILVTLTTPRKIQDFLDTTAYSPEYANRCPVRVMTDMRAHCLDGALFAAAALRRIGDMPLVVDLFPDPGLDDDHVLALFRRNSRWGAVAKSNFVGLRFREPVYNSLRELIMTYFEQFYNVNGLKTLRTHTRPVNLIQYDRYEWEWSDSGADRIEKALLARKRYAVISTEMAADLSLADELSYKAGLMVANWDGLYKPVE
jgi:hypothetical protein